MSACGAQGEGEEGGHAVDAARARQRRRARGEELASGSGTLPES
jgi:hypothetical protein